MIRYLIKATNKICKPRRQEQTSIFGNIFTRNVTYSDDGKPVFDINVDHTKSRVYVWGDHKNGKLGYYGEETEGFTPSKIHVLDSLQVSGISCGAEHSVAVNNDGKVMTWGLGEKFRLGHGEEESEGSPRLVEGLQHEHVISVTCGEQYTAALTESGDVYTWGDDSGRLFSSSGVLGHGNFDPQPYPKLIEAFREEDVRIVQIAGGKGHMVALDEHGGVWTWGKGEYGRLGNGEVGNVPTPEPVELFEEIPVKFVNSGEHHSCAIDDEGQVWLWGRNERGQLGIGGGLTMDMYCIESFPTELAANEDEHEVNELDGVYVGCGTTNSIMIADNNEVYAWGSGGWLAPHRMSVLSQKNVWKAECGGGTFYAITTDGEMYTWSKSGFMGNSKALGHGKGGFNSQVAQPTLVEAFKEQNLHVIDVAVGKNHAMAIVQEL
jgi:alpha-tubulin suppressor-like RCC1 family protein|eukprot:g1101.t1